MGGSGSPTTKPRGTSWSTRTRITPTTRASGLASSNCLLHSRRIMENMNIKKGIQFCSGLVSYLLVISTSWNNLTTSFHCEHCEHWLLCMSALNTALTRFIEWQDLSTSRIRAEVSQFFIVDLRRRKYISSYLPVRLSGSQYPVSCGLNWETHCFLWHFLWFDILLTQ